MHVLGYRILGIVLKKVSGVARGDFLREKVFLPAGMANARLWSRGEIVPKLAAGYQRRAGGGLAKGQITDPASIRGAGDVLCSLKDLEAFETAVAQRRLLSRANWGLTWKPIASVPGNLPTLSYGLGWYIDERKDGKVAFHTGGSMIGYRTALMRFVDHDVTVIILTNQNLTNVDNIARRVGTSYLNESSAESTQAN